MEKIHDIIRQILLLWKCFFIVSEQESEWKYERQGRFFASLIVGQYSSIAFPFLRKDWQIIQFKTGIKIEFYSEIASENLKKG